MSDELKLIYKNTPVDHGESRLKVVLVDDDERTAIVFLVDGVEVPRDVFDSVVQAMHLEALTMIAVLLRDISTEGR